MESCERYTDLLWDQLYGLLEPEQEQVLRGHLADCPGCQAALAEAQNQQRLVARAARMYDSAPFVPPADEIPEPAAPATTLQIPVKPPRSRRRWPWIGLAASVLLAVGAYLWYQTALAGYRSARDLAFRQIEELKTAKVEDRELESRLLRLQVLGPASYQPDAPNQYRVQVQDLKGTAVPAEVTVQVVAASPARPREQRVLASKRLDALGESTFTLPSNFHAPDQAQIRLEVQARRRGEAEKLDHPLAVAAPDLVTNLVIDRAVYQRGELLFFRALTLDRFSRKPPDRPFMLQAYLVDARGQRRLLFEGMLNKDGITAGQIALTDDLCEGEYTLEVSDRQNHFPPARRKFFLRDTRPPLLAKDLKFDKPTYTPGEQVRAEFHARQANGLPAANRRLDIRVRVGEREVAASTPVTDARGEAAIPFALPRDMADASARVEIQVQEQGRCERLVKEVPLAGRKAAPATVQVEFFPEGGQLVAGLPSRVYFRARNAKGEPVVLRAVLLDGNKQPVQDDQGQPVKVESKNDGLGFFRFTPAKGQAYSLQVVEPRGIQVQAPFPAPLNEGVVLAVPAGVSAEGEELRVRVRQAGSHPRLLVAVSCQGRLVDQKEVRSTGPETAVELSPPAGATGVLRVTVFQVRQGTLLPLAERLVFRLPARHLQLNVRPDKTQYQPGDHVRLELETRTEAGRPAPAVLLAAVVDRGALRWGSIKAEPNLPAPFYLTTALQRPEDLEQADILVEDNPRARAALDRFLGTQGWRRFAPPDGAPAPEGALAMKDANAPRLAADQRGLAVLQLDNGPQVEDRYNRAVAAERGRLVAAAEGRARQAETALADFEQLPGTWLHRAALGLIVVLLAAGCVALAVGFVRLARGTSPTPYFATAFGSLLVCLVTVFLTKSGPPAGDRGGPAGPGELAKTNDTRRDVGEGKEKPGAKEARSGALPPTREKVARAKPLVQKGTTMQMVRRADTDGARRAELDREVGAKTNEEAQGRGQPNPELQRRFFLQQAKQANVAGAGAGAKKEGPKVPMTNRAFPPAPAPNTGRAGPLRPRIGMSKVRPQIRPHLVLSPLPVEYAHLHPRFNPAGDLQETVLWAPLLQAPGGKAIANFDLSNRVTTFQVLVLGRDAEGRLGIAHGALLSRPAGPNKAK